MFGLLELLEKCLVVENNAALLREASLVATLELVKKLHKKKNILLQKVDTLISKLN